MAAGKIKSSPSAPFEKRYDCNTVIFHMVMARLDELGIDKKSPEIASFVNVPLTQNFESLVLKYTPLGEFLEKYGKKLRANPTYDAITKRILNVCLSKPATERECLYSFKNHLYSYFLPRDAETTCVHDDHIMMIFLMTVEMIVQALQNQKGQLALSLLSTSSVFLCPQGVHRNKVFSVSNWVFRDWLKNAEKILYPQRQPDMIIDVNLLRHKPPRREDDPLGPMLPTTLIQENKWKTGFASNKTPESPVPPPVTLKNPLNRIQIRDIFHSFLCDRLDPRISEVNKKTFLEQRQIRYTDRLLGRLMNVAADKIADSFDYKLIEDSIAKKYHSEETMQLKAKAVFRGINSMVFDIDNKFTFLQVVAAFLVLSRCNNEILLNGTILESQFFFKQAILDVFNPRRTLKNLWSKYIEDPEQKIKDIHTEDIEFLINPLEEILDTAPGQVNLPPERSRRSSAPSALIIEPGSTIVGYIFPPVARQARPQAPAEGPKPASPRADTQARPPASSTIPRPAPPRADTQARPPASSTVPRPSSPRAAKKARPPASSTIPRPTSPRAATKARPPASSTIPRPALTSAATQAEPLSTATVPRAVLAPAAIQARPPAPVTLVGYVLPPAAPQTTQAATEKDPMMVLLPASTVAKPPITAMVQMSVLPLAATQVEPPTTETVQAPVLPPPDIQGGPPSTGTAPNPTTPPTRAKSLSPSSVLSMDLLEEILGISGDLSPSCDLEVDLGDDPTLGGLLQDANEQLFDILLEGGVDCDLTEDPTEYNDMLSDEEEVEPPSKRPRTE